MDTLRRSGILLPLVLCLACAAPPAPTWDDGGRIIGPARGPGFLSVEENDPHGILTTAPLLKLAPFVLYDEAGRFVLRNGDPYPHLPPAALRPGRYIVVAQVAFRESRIQVRIEEGRLTRVNLSALETSEATEPAPPPTVRP